MEMTWVNRTQTSDSMAEIRSDPSVTDFFLSGADPQCAPLIMGLVVKYPIFKSTDSKKTRITSQNPQILSTGVLGARGESKCNIAR